MKILKLIILLLFPLILNAQKCFHRDSSGLIYYYGQIFKDSVLISHRTSIIPEVDTVNCTVIAFDTTTYSKPIKILQGYVVFQLFQKNIYLDYNKKPIDKRYWILGRLIKP